MKNFLTSGDKSAAINVYLFICLFVCSSILITSNVSAKEISGGQEFLVNTNTTAGQFGAGVTILSNDNFVVIWSSENQDGSGRGVYCQIFDKIGTKIGDEIQVNNFTAGYQTWPAIATIDDGNFVIIWSSDEQDGSGYGVFGQLFDYNGVKVNNEFQVNNYTIGDQYTHDKSIVVFNNGDFFVLWNSAEQDGDGEGVYGRKLDLSGMKIGEEFMISTNTISHQAHPHGTVLKNGNFLCVWQSNDQDGDGYGAYGQILTSSGTKIGNEFRINTVTAGNQEWPAATTLENGNVVVVWRSDCHSSSGKCIYGKILDEAGNEVIGEFRVDTYSSQATHAVYVISFKNGNFLVVWENQGQDGSDYGVYGQLFDSSANKIGQEFRSNVYTAGIQRVPVASAFNDNTFVVVWQGQGTLDNSGVYGRIFNQNTIPTISEVTKSGTKNKVLHFSLPDFEKAFEDADSDNMAQILISTLPNNGNLKLSGVGSVSEGQVVIANDIDNLVFDPDKDFMGTTNFAWKGHDGLQYSNNVADVTIKIKDADPDWLEKWWPVVTATTIAVIGIPIAVISAVLVKKAQKCKCCFKEKERTIELNDEGKLVVKEEI